MRAALGVIVLPWLWDRFTRWSPTPARTAPSGHRTPPGPEVRAEHRPTAWPRTEAGRRSFVRYLARKLLEQHLLPPVAVPLFIAHTARETGYGAAVWNHNFGNEKQFGHGPWMRLADHEPYMAFQSAEQGIAHNVLRVRRQWPHPWSKLVVGDRTWYGDLGRAGYYESNPDEAQAEYDGMLARVKGYLRG